MAFFTNFIKLTPSSSGATVISGTQGALTTWCDWALPQAGWTTLFTATNRRIYQAPSGNRFPVLVEDNSATTGDARVAIVRGCVSATNITTLVDPFPNTTQVPDANCNWLKSNTASATARDWIGYVFDWGFYLAINVDGNPETYPLYIYTDTVERLSGDTWGTVISVRNSTAFTSIIGFNGGSGASTQWGSGAVVSPLSIFAARSSTGAIKSSVQTGSMLGNTSGVGPGATAGQPPILGGPGSTIDMIQTCITDNASTTAAFGSAICLNRGYVPNMRTPCHSSLLGVSITGDFEQSSHDPAAKFRLIKTGNIAGSTGVIIEETNTWKGTSTG